jgi:hypothetical protein
MRRISCLLLIIIVGLFSLSVAVAGEKDGHAGDLLVVKGITREQLEGNDLVKKFCTSCHTESRIYNKLKEMHADRNVDYANDIKYVVVKKIRLTGGNISHNDGKKILEYLVAL